MDFAFYAKLVQIMTAQQKTVPHSKLHTDNLARLKYSFRKKLISNNFVYMKTKWEKTSHKPPRHVQNKDSQIPQILHITFGLSTLFPILLFSSRCLSIAFGPALLAVINEWSANTNVQQKSPRELIKTDCWATPRLIHYIWHETQNLHF